MTPRKVTVELSAVVWWKLAEKAEEVGKNAPELLAELAEKFLTGKLSQNRQNQGPDTLARQVVLLNAAGFNDTRIADMLDCSPSTVKTKRQKLGVPPARQGN